MSPPLARRSRSASAAIASNTLASPAPSADRFAHTSSPSANGANEAGEGDGSEMSEAKREDANDCAGDNNELSRPLLLRFRLRPAALPVCPGFPFCLPYLSFLSYLLLAPE